MPFYRILIFASFSHYLFAHSSSHKFAPREALNQAHVEATNHRYNRRGSLVLGTGSNILRANLRAEQASSRVISPGDPNQAQGNSSRSRSSSSSNSSDQESESETSSSSDDDEEVTMTSTRSQAAADSGAPGDSGDPPARVNPPTAPEDPDKLIQVKESVHENYKKKARKLSEANREIKELEKVIADWEKHSRTKSKQIDAITNSLHGVNKLKDTLEAEVSKKDKVIESLKEELESVKQSLRKGGKVAACELNKALVDKVTEATKKVLFRTVKFVLDDEDLKELTKEIVQYLPNKELDIKWWRDDIRHYNLVTDTQPVAGVEKVNVTITSEAFGFLSYENYHDSWKKQMKYKEKYGPDALLPKSKKDIDEDGKDISYYKSKWSNSTTGQVKYGGWEDAAYQAFEVHKNWVKMWRENEEKNGKPLQKYALKLIQEKNKKKIAKAKESGRKRGQKKQPTPQPNKAKMARIDE